MATGAKPRPRGGSAAPPAKEPPARRGRWRVVATDRVEYEVDGRRQVAFLAQLGLDGMHLRSASGLAPGASLVFRLFLDGLGEPLALEGAMATAGSDGA